jgi:DNA processing protein
MDFQTISKDQYPRIFPTLSPDQYPETLQFEGNSEHIFSQNPRIAIVGTRNITPYGRKIISEIIPPLANQGFTIVSGGAFGVDIESQKTAFHFTNKLITVLGSGLHHKAPKTNKPFFTKVIKSGGTILSPFPEDIHPTKYTFVQRNQIIASMTDLVIVIEAGQKSGSIHTANYASEQGIPVASFPGNIHNPLSKGTNQLIQNGAHLVTSTDEIISLIPKHRLEKLKPSSKRQITKPQSVYNELYQMLS